jgi:di/tricarboxylate transporter
LFVTEAVSVDVVTLLLVSVLIATGILTPLEAFAGFGSEALVILGSIFVLGGALQQTGVLEVIAHGILKMAGRKERRLSGIVMLLSSSISAVMNNTTVVAIFAPQVSALAKKAGVSSSRLLLPLAFAAIMGGTCTLIGTSTNIAVSGFLSSSGMEPVRFLEITPIGIACTLAGAAFLIVLGPVLLPDNRGTSVREIQDTQARLSDADVIPLSRISPETTIPCADETSAFPGKRRLSIVLSPLLFLLAITVGTSELLPLSGALLMGAVLVILTGCITPDQARGFIDWRLLILIGGMSAFGVAMENSGAADWLAASVVRFASPFGVMAVLGGFLLLTVLLTQPMSNAAAALVVIPIAIKAAEQIGAEPRTFAIGVMLAASLSFITPFEPASLLVYKAGNYRFMDFLKIGSLLTLLLLAILLWLLPHFFPLMEA